MGTTRVTNSRSNKKAKAHQQKKNGMAAKSTGTVKWFSNHKGFGFITPTSDNCPTKEDIFVHKSSIVMENGAFPTLQVRNDTTHCFTYSVQYDSRNALGGKTYFWILSKDGAKKRH
jgi:cold shock CspA family protein